VVQASATLLFVTCVTERVGAAGAAGVIVTLAGAVALGSAFDAAVTLTDVMAG
jgi:hypothetical protein